MPITDLARVVIQTAAQLVTRVGFGTPMFIGMCTAWGASPDRVRAYSGLAGLVSDGFAVTDPEYLAAAALLSQPNPPPLFKLGRRLNLPTMQWVITPTAANLTKYTVTIDGQDAVFTSDGTATVAEICTGLKAAIDALAAPVLAITTTNEGPGTDIKIVANVAGAWHSLKAMQAADPTAPNAFLDVKQTHVDPGITADLVAIRAANADWYAFCLTTQGAAEIAAAAAWADSNRPVLFFADTQDSGVYGNGNTDIAFTQHAAARATAIISREPDNSAFRCAAWMGFGLPTEPGTENWANMPLGSQTPETYTAQQLLNMAGDPGNGPGGKFCNFFYAPATGLTATRMGVVAGGEYIDVVRFLDSFKIGLEEDIAQAIADAGALATKIPFDDAGIAKIENLIRSRVKAGQDAGAIEVTPAPTFIVPKASSFTAAQRKSRALTGLGCTFQLTGAINIVSLVTVTVS